MKAEFQVSSLGIKGMVVQLIIKKRKGGRIGLGEKVVNLIVDMLNLRCQWDIKVAFNIIYH